MKTGKEISKAANLYVMNLQGCRELIQHTQLHEGYGNN